MSQNSLKFTEDKIKLEMGAVINWIKVEREEHRTNKSLSLDRLNLSQTTKIKIMSNKIIHCPICESREIAIIKNSIRNSDLISVAKCVECSHVFLDSFDHIDNEYFKNNEFLQSKTLGDIKLAETLEDRLKHFAEENQNRFNRINRMICNKDVLEFGAGAGGLLNLVSPYCKSIKAIEKTGRFKTRLKSDGFEVYESIKDVEGCVDVIISFHVLEHVSNPISMLQACYQQLKPGGHLYFEVPNLNDVLLSIYEVPEYEEFYYFKDHLHYFTRQTLGLICEKAGISHFTITGHNRFGLDNHLYWLRHGKPGGHNIWNFLSGGNDAYCKSLAASDLSDSLILQANKK